MRSHTATTFSISPLSISAVEKNDAVRDDVVKRLTTTPLQMSVTFVFNLYRFQLKDKTIILDDRKIV